jgi:hypothetical protein
MRTFVNTIDKQKKLLISDDNSYIIYENTKLPLEYISSDKFGKPNVLSQVADIPVAGRDIIKIIKYRTEGRDLNIVFIYDEKVYKFDHIKFSNMEFR